MKQDALIPSDQIPHWRRAAALLLQAFTLLHTGANALPVQGHFAPRGLARLVRRLEQLVRGLVLSLALVLPDRAQRAGQFASSLPGPDLRPGTSLPGLRLFPMDASHNPPLAMAALAHLRAASSGRAGGKTRQRLVNRLLALEAVLTDPHRAARRMKRHLGDRQRQCGDVPVGRAISLPPYNDVAAIHDAEAADANYNDSS